MRRNLKGHTTWKEHRQKSFPEEASKNKKKEGIAIIVEVSNVGPGVM
jgi:hypothetical protein